jgi:hypothetical protein
MKPYTLSLIFACSLLLLIGCSTKKQLYTDNYPVENKIFLKPEINGGEIVDKLLYTPDTNIDLPMLINLLTADVGEYAFEPIVVTGKTDWDFLSEQWQYQENHVTYLRKLTLDIKTNTPAFGGSRVILVHLNKDTLYTDKNNLGYVEFRGGATIRLTHHIGIATFKGDIIDVPTK